MDSGPPRVTVQSIREKFEGQGIKCHHPFVGDNSVESAIEFNYGTASPESDNGPTGFLPHNRISIKRSPAFRTGTKVETLVINKKPSLKRKPGVDRTSKPSNIHLVHNSKPPTPIFCNGERNDGPGDCGQILDHLHCQTRSPPNSGKVNNSDFIVEEALKAPLPSGPAPKKPPRTFLHDLYMETKGIVATSANCAPREPESHDISPQRPARKKSSKSAQRPVSVPFVMMRSKTEPSFARLRKEPGSSVDSVSVESADNAVLSNDHSFGKDITNSEDLTQCRWSNPVEWNSFSPPRKSKSSTSTLRISPENPMAKKTNRMSTSLLTILDHSKQRKEGIASPSKILPIKNGDEAATDGRNGHSLMSPSEPVWVATNGSSFVNRSENNLIDKSAKADLQPRSKRHARPSQTKQAEHICNQPDGNTELHYMCSPIVEVADQKNWDNPDRLEESDCESENEFRRTQMVEDRKIYIRRVSSKVCDLRKARASSWTSSNDGHGLFDTFLVIALYYDRHLHRHTPYIKSHYPYQINIPNGVEQFCFPDFTHWPPPSHLSSSEPFTIILTDNKGDRQYGYCRRIVPEGTETCIPITYCILTRHRANGFYYRVINLLASQHGVAESQRIALLEYLFKQSYPAPGSEIECIIDDDVIKMERLLDGRLEEIDLRVLFDHLNDTVILHILGTLLLERKLILLSQNISVLSQCIEAVQSMLYPFVWQHTLIPILPEAMTDICLAPTPFIIGMLTQNVADFQAIAPDQGMLINLDSGKVLHSVGDESSILPRCSVRLFKSMLELTLNFTHRTEPARNVLLSDSFLRLFVELCGHYEQHIHKAESGQKNFERTAFIRGHASRNVQMFLEWFTETAMFNLFIESRLRQDAAPSLFERKMKEYPANIVRNSQLILRNSKVLGRKIKTIGDKLREMNVFS